MRLTRKCERLGFCLAIAWLLYSIYWNYMWHICQRNWFSNGLPDSNVPASFVELLVKFNQSPWIDEMYKTHDSGFQKVENMSTYLLSWAFASNSSNDGCWDKFVLVGWEHIQQNSSEYKCCFLLQHSIIKETEMNEKIRYSPSASLNARQFLCNRTFVSADRVEGLTLAGATQSCPFNRSSYLNVKYLYRPVRKNFCITIKDVHDDKNAVELIEWFEVQKLFGVEKVLVYPVSNLNRDAVKVLLYYQLSGLVEIIPFYHVPEKEKVKREFTSNYNGNTYNDEQVTVFDSSERLKECWYAALIDTDEFIMPINKSITSYIQLMDEMLQRNPGTVGFLFDVHVHMTSWEATNINSEISFGKYLNRTNPISDTMKVAFVPERAKQGSLYTHGVQPIGGYER